MAEERLVLLGAGEIALLTRIAVALEKIAVHQENIDINTEKIEITHAAMYDRMNDKMKGIYMTQSCNYQCHKSQDMAAFDAAVERADMVDLVKDKIENPIDWGDDF